MFEDLVRFGLIPGQGIGVPEARPGFGIVLFQFERPLKLGNCLWQLSSLLIRPAQETMGEPKSRINLNSAMQLLNCGVPLSCKYQGCSHGKGREPGEWVGLLCPLSFRERLVVAAHRRQEPTVVRVSFRIVGTQFNGSFELTFRRG